MATRVNPMLIDDLERYGAEDVTKCYHCGNCTATCPFSQDPFLFPRRSMRYLQMGLEKPLRSSLEPWLCYYCGECSEECPREADPGETMMSIRRWLISQYDFTGLSRLFYRSWKAELTAILIMAMLTAVGFLTFGFQYGGGNLSIYDGPQAFLPAGSVHIFDWSMGTILFLLLAINSIHMWHLTMRGEGKPDISFWSYVRFLPVTVTHFFTQKRYRDCDDKRPWALHLVLMLSYLTMLVLIMFFLHAMQYGPEIKWQAHIFGYAASIGLVVTATLALRGRIKKDAPANRHSHESDWMFLGMLIFVSVTGIVQHLLHRLGMPTAANIAYVVHLMGVVPMLTVEVPFSKWSHLAYRPLAMYFASLQQEAYATAQARAIDKAANLQPVA
jgi:ferredoxin/energy-converting hydrogenase Eha subunit A